MYIYGGGGGGGGGQVMVYIVHAYTCMYIRMCVVFLPSVCSYPRCVPTLGVFTCSRDDAQTKMVALKEKMDKELKQYNAEIKELIIVIEHDRKLKEFMSKKGVCIHTYTSMFTSQCQNGGKSCTYIRMCLHTYIHRCVCA